MRFNAMTPGNTGLRLFLLLLLLATQKESLRPIGQRSQACRNDQYKIAQKLRDI